MTPSMLTLFVAISLSIPGQKLAPAVAASDPALAKVCAEILQAARQRDVALLVPLFADPVDIAGRQSLGRPEVLILVQTWPEDFDPSFWRDLRDVVQSGVADSDDEYIWRRPGTVLQFYKTNDGFRIAAIHMDRKPRTKIMPVDAAASDPGLAEVRAQIMRAIARRDVDMLVPILGPEIQVTFDTPISASDFVANRKACTVDLCGDFWRDFHDAMSLGMANEGEGAVVAPYVAVKWPDADDSAEALVITGPRVALRSAPVADAPAIEWLSYDIVTMADVSEWVNSSRPLRIDGYEYGWWQVVSRSGKTGWVSEKYARSGFDTRVAFKKIDGKWKMISIVNGD